jgi:hypothetical protein
MFGVLVILAGIPFFYRWRGKKDDLAISNAALSQPAPE